MNPRSRRLRHRRSCPRGACTGISTRNDAHDGFTAHSTRGPDQGAARLHPDRTDGQPDRAWCPGRPRAAVVQCGIPQQSPGVIQQLIRCVCPSLARSEAIKRNASVTMCRSSNGTSCATSGGWQQGWIIFSDSGAGGNAGNDTVDSDETRVLYQQNLASDYSFTGSNSIVFQPTGLVATAASLTLCRQNPSPGSQERTIAVSATGRASVATTRTGTCP